MYCICATAKRVGFGWQSFLCWERTHCLRQLSVHTNDWKELAGQVPSHLPTVKSIQITVVTWLTSPSCPPEYWMPGLGEKESKYITLQSCLIGQETWLFFTNADEIHLQVFLLPDCAWTVKWESEHRWAYLFVTLLPCTGAQLIGSLCCLPHPTPL